MADKKKVNGLAKWIDENFGNRDGKLTLRDIFKDAPTIALIIIDIVMLVAEYRVFMVGLALTNDTILAVGFILISSLPFYLGQIAFVYNDANIKQQWIASGLILMGLAVSGYYGLAEYLLQAGLIINEQTVYEVAIMATIALIVMGLIYALVDDKISATRRLNRLDRMSKDKLREMNMREELLEKAAKLQAREDALRERYGVSAVDIINATSFGMASDAEQATLKDESPNARSH